MRKEQNEKKMNEDVGGKKNKSVAQILTKTTMTTWTIISTATQLICLDIEHDYDQRMMENLQTYPL
jgi:hypothetical protein